MRVRSLIKVGVAGLALLTATAASAADIIIRNVTVIDPLVGALGVRDIEVRAHRVARIARPGQIERSRHLVIDGSGKFVIPGLWDMHGHVSDEASAPLYVLNGITGVRQMFGHTASFAWRHRGLEGTPAMPRMYLGSPLIDGSPAHVPGSIEVTTAAEARQVVRTVKSSSAQFLKVYSKVPPTAYNALMNEAAKVGLRVEGHVPDSVSWASVAAQGGQRSIEHLWGLPRWVASNAEDLSARTAKFYDNVTWGGTLTPEQQARTIELQNEAYNNYDPKRFKKLVADLARNRIWQSPTLIVWETRIREADAGNLEDRRLNYMPAWMRDFWKGKVAADGNDKPAAKALSTRRHRFNLDRLREMHRAGIPILAGSDAPLPYVFPGWSLHEELSLMVEAGLSPLEALRTATSNAGLFMGRRDIGRLTKGAVADLVVLTADPTSDIRNVGKIDSVIINGVLVDRQAREAGFARLKRVAEAPVVGNLMIEAYKEGGLAAASKAYRDHCPAPIEQMDCTGINAAEYGLAPVIEQSNNKTGYGAFVSWAERTFADQADVQIWAGLQHRKAGNRVRAEAAFKQALTIAPGDPLAMHLHESKPPASRN